MKNNDDMIAISNIPILTSHAISEQTLKIRETTEHRMRHIRANDSHESSLYNNIHR